MVAKVEVRPVLRQARGVRGLTVSIVESLKWASSAFEYGMS